MIRVPLDCCRSSCHTDRWARGAWKALRVTRWKDSRLSAKPLAAFRTFMRGLERKLASALTADVQSITSVAVHQGREIKGRISPFHNLLGVALAIRTYRADRELLSSSRLPRLGTRGCK